MDVVFVFQQSPDWHSMPAVFSDHDFNEQSKAGYESRAYASMDLSKAETHATKTWAFENQIECFVLHQSLPTDIKLVVFDMDSTLIGVEVIDELAKELNIGEQISEITERAMQGELDFKQSLRQRVALLEGLSDQAIEAVSVRLPVNPGVINLVASLKAMGVSTAVVSGGFRPFVEKLKSKLGLDFALANELEIENGALTGCVQGDIVDAQIKAQTLKKLAAEQGLNTETQTMAVGDGANDLQMMSVASLGVAYRAKPLVREQADIELNFLPMDALLVLL